jgi:predicted RNA-binding Zn ribbon-like protein
MVTRDVSAAPVLLPTAAESPPVLLMNTIWADRTAVHDSLPDVAALRSWLSAAGLPAAGGGHRNAPSVRGDDLDQFRTLRTALRTLAAAATDDDRRRAVEAVPRMRLNAAAATLNAAAAVAPVTALLHLPEWRQGWMSPPGTRAATAALGQVARGAVHIFATTERELLRACHAPGCVLYFSKDHPRREWCSSTCGNRARVARHYKRHHSSRDE